MTANHLRTLERVYRNAAADVETLRATRNEAIREALAEGWTYQQISDATGMSRTRVGQIKDQAPRLAQGDKAP